MDVLDGLVVLGTVLAAVGAIWMTHQPGAGLLVIGIAIAVVGLLASRR